MKAMPLGVSARQLGWTVFAGCLAAAAFPPISAYPLILVSMGAIKFSLMAAYSSTSFGIIFVCVFKIFNLRPARRRLLLEAEAEAAAPAATPTRGTPS